MKKLVISSTLIALLLLVASVSAENIGIVVSEDCGVSPSFPDDNYGSDKRFFGPSYTVFDRGYAKFNIAPLKGVEVTDAGLFVYSRSGCGSCPGVCVHHVYNQEWLEEEITRNDQPCGVAFDDPVLCNLSAESCVMGGAGWRKFIVTNAVRESVNAGNDNISFVIKGPPYLEVTSKESGEALAYLSIDYTPPTCEDRIIDLEERMDAVETSVSNLDGRVTSVEGGLVLAEANIASLQADFAGLEGRVTALEGSLLTVLDRIAQLEFYVNMVVCQLLPQGIVRDLTCPLF